MDFVNHTLFIALRWLSQPGSLRKSQDQMVEQRPIKIPIKTSQNSLRVGQLLSRVCLVYLPQGLWPTRLQERKLEWVAIPFSRGSNPGLLHCGQILYCLSRQGSPRTV